MTSPATVSNAQRQSLCPHPGTDPSANRFHGRYPARLQQIHDRVEGERTLLSLALTAFQAELAAKAA